MLRNKGKLAVLDRTKDVTKGDRVNISVTELRGILPKPSKSLTLEEIREIKNQMYIRNLPI